MVPALEHSFSINHNFLQSLKSLHALESCSLFAQKTLHLFINRIVNQERTNRAKKRLKSLFLLFSAISFRILFLFFRVQRSSDYEWRQFALLPSIEEFHYLLRRGDSQLAIVIFFIYD